MIDLYGHGPVVQLTHFGPETIPANMLSPLLRHVLENAARRETRPVLSLQAVILAALDETDNPTIGALAALEAALKEVK